MQTLPIKQILKTSLSIFAVFAIVWVGVIAWWKHGNRIPSTRDITDYLVLMPSVIVIAYTLLGRMIGGIKQTLVSTPGSATPAPATAAPQTDAQPDTPRTPAVARTAAFRHAILRSPLGAHSGMIKAALKEGRTAPLDAALLNLSGYPRRAARVADLRPEALNDTRARLSPAAGVSPGAMALSISDVSLRAAALLFDVCGEALQHVHQACAGMPPQVDAQGRRQPLAVTLAAIVPDDWSSALTQRATEALQVRHNEIAAQHGHASSVALQVTARSAEGSDTAYRVVAEAIDRLHGAPLRGEALPAGFSQRVGPAVIIVAAAHSSISDEPESTLSAAGEAAVALILGAMPDDTAPLPYAEPPAVALSTPGFAPSIAADGADAQTDAGSPLPVWEALTHTTLAAARASTDTMSAVYSDAGSNGPDSITISALWNRTVAALAAERRCLATDGACGATGAAGALLSVALAAADTAEHGKPALAVTLSDRRELAMLVTRPGNALSDIADIDMHADAGVPAPASSNAADSPVHSQPLAA